MGKLKIETKLKFFSAVYTGLLNHCSLHAALNNKIKTRKALFHRKFLSSFLLILTQIKPKLKRLL